MSKRSTTTNVAIAALIVSIAGGTFSFYQWLNSESENRISVAVEISKNYLKERDQTASFLVLKTIYNGADSISSDEAEKIARYADLLSYIAFLTNNNRLDKSYLADTIACDIFYVDKAIAILKNYFDKQDEQMQAFIKTYPCRAKIPIQRPSH
jgi:hypothetical protein